MPKKKGGGSVSHSGGAARTYSYLTSSFTTSLLLRFTAGALLLVTLSQRGSLKLFTTGFTTSLLLSFTAGALLLVTLSQRGSLKLYQVG